MSICFNLLIKLYSSWTCCGGEKYICFSALESKALLLECCKLKIQLKDIWYQDCDCDGTIGTQYYLAVKLVRLPVCASIEFNRFPVFQPDTKRCREGMESVWSKPCLTHRPLGWILYQKIFDDTMETKLWYNFTLENITFPGEGRGGIFNS